MGLSSSQGRLLMLTSRLSDIELSEMLISQTQTSLATDKEQAASNYMEATSNYKLTIKVTDSSSSTGYSKEDLTYDNLTEAGYLVTNSKNQIYLKKDENGNWIIPTYINANGDEEDILSINSDGKAVIGENEYEIIDGSSFLSDKDTLQNAIMNGVVFLCDVNNSTTGISMDTLESDTSIEYVLDTSDDAQAESEYNYELTRLERKDNQLDLELQQLETEHEAVLKEYDSVKEVISNNVDRTFSLFSDS
ncbi:MAG: hypothetical protein LUH05_09260 [Candidatus Gastranaerophilales bacterium]|nr:hypothetical protein [Candidatus Gastranaerophilales bacterium]